MVWRGSFRWGCAGPNHSNFLIHWACGWAQALGCHMVSLKLIFSSSSFPERKEVLVERIRKSVVGRKTKQNKNLFGWDWQGTFGRAQGKGGCEWQNRKPEGPLWEGGSRCQEFAQTCLCRRAASSLLDLRLRRCFFLTSLGDYGAEVYQEMTLRDQGDPR